MAASLSLVRIHRGLWTAENCRNNGSSCCSPQAAFFHYVIFRKVSPRTLREPYLAALYQLTFYNVNVYL